MPGHIYRKRRADGSWSTWYAVVDVPKGSAWRRRQRRSSHVTRQAAQKWIAAQLGPDGSRQQAAGVTVGEYLQTWLDGKQSLRASTRLSYRGHIHRYLIPMLGQHLLVDLDALDIEAAYRDYLLEDGNALTVTTVHRIHATLMSALNTAVRRGLIDRNPAETVELPPVHRALPAKWTAVQASRFLESCKDDEWAMLYRLLLVTGMRRGEAIALRWRDIDLDEGLVTVRSQLVAVGGDIVEGPPKSSAGGRTIVLDEATRQELILYALERGEGEVDPDSYVFARDGRPLSPAFASRHFTRLSLAAGVPTIRLHDLRHTSASLGLAAGESLVEVSRRLGHSSIGITADVYTHVDTDVARISADRRARLLTGGGASTAKWERHLGLVEQEPRA